MYSGFLGFWICNNFYLCWLKRQFIAAHIAIIIEKIATQIIPYESPD